MSVTALVVVVLYLAGVSLLGLWFSRRQDSTEQYFLGNRSFPWWAVAWSLIGTIIGSTTFIGHPGEVFRTNMWNAPLHLMLIPIIFLVARYLVIFYRRTLKMSVYGFLERRFGYPARLYGGLAFVFSRIVDISATLYFLAVAVALLTSWEIRTVIVLIGILTVAYTYLGGITAVVWTDVIQGVVLVSGALACLLFILLGSAETPGELLSTAWEGGKFSWGSWRFSLTQDNVWILMILGVVWALQRYATDQHMVQRYLIARSDEEAKRAVYFGGLSALPIWILFWLVGALLWAHYETSAPVLPPELLANQSRILPHFILTEFPPVLLGLIVAALAAAAMSSLDSDINAVATVVVEDYYDRVRPGASERNRLRAGKWTVVIMGTLCILAALQWIGVQSAIGFMFDLISVATAGVLGLFVLGILFRRATARGAFAGIVTCVLFTAWATFTAVELPALGGTLLDLGPANYPWNTKLIGVFSSLVLLAVGLAASAALGGMRPDRASLTLWGLKDEREDSVTRGRAVPRGADA